MAKMNESGISGRVGPVIYYNLNGKSIIRSLPHRYKQTKATKASASEFGRASSIASCIRAQLYPVIPNPSDNKMQTRLVSAVFEWIREIRGKTDVTGRVNLLEGFNFFEQSTPTVYEREFPGIQVSSPSAGIVQIKIPSFIPKTRIKAPAHTQHIVCKIATGVTDLKNNRSMDNEYVMFEIEYNDTEVPEQTISFKLPTRENTLIVTGASLTYQVSKAGKIRDNKNKAFMPAEILSAVCL